MFSGPEGSLSCHLDPVDGWCCSVRLSPYQFSACWICHFLIEGGWNLQLREWICLFPRAVLSALPYVCWPSVFGYISVIKIVTSSQRIDPLLLCDARFYPRWFSLFWSLLCLKWIEQLWLRLAWPFSISLLFISMSVFKVGFL